MAASRLKTIGTLAWEQNYWKIAAFILIPLLCLPLPLVAWQTESGKAAYILLVTSMFLVFEILPIPVTALFTIFLMPIIGVQTTRQVAAAFTSDSYFLLIAAIILALSVEITNTHTRLAMIALMKIGFSPSRLLLGFVVISGGLSMWIANTAVTVMILPIAIAVADTIRKPPPDNDRDTLISKNSIIRRRQKLYRNGSIGEPLAGDLEVSSIATGNERMASTDLVNARRGSADIISDHLISERKGSTDLTIVSDTITSSRLSEGSIKAKLRMEDNFSKALQLSVAFSANIGGIATLIGSQPNIIFRMTLEKYYGTETGLNFLTYLLVCGPIAIGALLLTWVALCILYVPGWMKRPGQRTPDQKYSEFRRRSSGTIETKLRDLGPMRHEEISVLLVFAVVLILWLTRNPQVIPGWGRLFRRGYANHAMRYATDSMPAIFAAVILFVCPADYHEFKQGTYRPILTWKAVARKIPWDLLLFVGCLASVAHVTEVTGLNRAIGSLVPDLRGVPSWMVIAVICVAMSVLTEITNNSVMASVFVPVLANVAEDSGVNPIYYMLAVTLASMFDFMLPISSLPTIIVYSHGTVKMKDMMKAGVIPKVACVVFLILSLEVLGWLVFDVKTFPHWAEERLIHRSNYTRFTTTVATTVPTTTLKQFL